MMSHFKLSDLSFGLDLTFCFSKQVFFFYFIGRAFDYLNNNKKKVIIWRHFRHQLNWTHLSNRRKLIENFSFESSWSKWNCTEQISATWLKIPFDLRILLDFTISAKIFFKLSPILFEPWFGFRFRSLTRNHHYNRESIKKQVSTFQLTNDLDPLFLVRSVILCVPFLSIEGSSINGDIFWGEGRGFFGFW